MGQEALGLSDDVWERYALGDVPDQTSIASDRRKGEGQKAAGLPKSVAEGDALR